MTWKYYYNLGWFIANSNCRPVNGKKKRIDTIRVFQVIGVRQILKLSFRFKWQCISMKRSNPRSREAALKKAKKYIARHSS